MARQGPAEAVTAAHAKANGWTSPYLEGPPHGASVKAACILVVLLAGCAVPAADGPGPAPVPALPWIEDLPVDERSWIHTAPVCTPAGVACFEGLARVPVAPPENVSLVGARFTLSDLEGNIRKDVHWVITCQASREGCNGDLLADVTGPLPLEVVLEELSAPPGAWLDHGVGIVGAVPVVEDGQIRLQGHLRVRHDPGAVLLEELVRHEVRDVVPTAPCYPRIEPNCHVFSSVAFHPIGTLKGPLVGFAFNLSWDAATPENREMRVELWCRNDWGEPDPGCHKARHPGAEGPSVLAFAGNGSGYGRGAPLELHIEPVLAGEGSIGTRVEVTVEGWYDVLEQSVSRAT